jgi:hypothetical protein
MLGALPKERAESSRAGVRDPSKAIPFVNRTLTRSQRERHGITGAREPPVGRICFGDMGARSRAIAVCAAMLACLATPELGNARPATRAHAAQVTAARADAVFAGWLNQHFRHRTHTYATCPDFYPTGPVVCQAEFKQGRFWYAASLNVSLAGGRLVVAYPSYQRWLRRWSAYSARILSGVGKIPGVTSVNSPDFDWAWLAAQLYQHWQRHEQTFSGDSYDGDSRGLDTFFVFFCQAASDHVICANKLGDAIYWLPYGVPPANEPASGWTPDQIEAAYGIADAARTAGRGSTVAIVDAFKDTQLDHDLAAYRHRYGLPPCRSKDGCLTILNQFGKRSPLPRTSAADHWEYFHRSFRASWATEQSLDVEMVSVACPLCKIVVVQANSLRPADLLRAEDAAAAVPGVKAVSNSWGSPEVSGEAQEASHFSHRRVAFVASAGDSGHGAQFPAALSGVIAVGGTELALNNGTYSGLEQTTRAQQEADAPISCLHQHGSALPPRALAIHARDRGWRTTSPRGRRPERLRHRRSLLAAARPRSRLDPSGRGHERERAVDRRHGRPRG